MKVKTDIGIWTGNVRIQATDTGFSFEKTSDPEQHGKLIFFSPENAENIKTAIEDYIRARDTIRDLRFNSPATPPNLE